MKNKKVRKEYPQTPASMIWQGIIGFVPLKEDGIVSENIVAENIKGL